jgi:hypothetical protein
VETAVRQHGAVDFDGVLNQESPFADDEPRGRIDKIKDNSVHDIQVRAMIDLKDGFRERALHWQRRVIGMRKFGDHERTRTIGKAWFENRQQGTLLQRLDQWLKESSVSAAGAFATPREQLGGEPADE